MLHYSRAKKNKHQDDDESLPSPYLYEDHKMTSNSSNSLSDETRAELGRDIFSMRQHFKHTVKKLRKAHYDIGWIRDVPESGKVNNQIRLRSQRV